MKALENHFRLGMHYENWEFQLENHQDLTIADRYDIIDVSYYQEICRIHGLVKIQLYFNADILVKVTASYYEEEEKRKSFVSYGYEKYDKIE